jgi:glycine/D-amino acid oxidase-like deaminating enzyme
VLADGTLLQAKTVVVAAGAWSKTLAKSLGDHAPLETERGYNTTLPRDAFPLQRQLYFKRSRLCRYTLVDRHQNWWRGGTGRP